MSVVRFHSEAPFAGVAQLAEQLICNQQVAGSSPIASSKRICGMKAMHIVGRFPSGQREQTVNLPSQTSVVRIHPCPPTYAGMAELADALDSGSSVRLGHAGSSPVSRTKGLHNCNPFFVQTILKLAVSGWLIGKSSFPRLKFKQKISLNRTA